MRQQGRFNFVIIHALKMQEEAGSNALLAVFESRKQKDRLLPEMKRHVLEMLDGAGSITYTEEVLHRLYKKMQ